MNPSQALDKALAEQLGALHLELAKVRIINATQAQMITNLTAEIGKLKQDLAEAKNEAAEPHLPLNGQSNGAHQ